MLASALLAPLRLRRGPAELAASERAAPAADAILLVARELTWFGATERTMARRLRAVMIEAGCEEVLSVLVAVCAPHGARRLSAGSRDLHVIDR
ncbi:hypothetical protein GCM10017673_53330 [Streptosporangium violaceochromogenes]|nr:hypothetical protein GCM10017673_53330 [Streptosporangium violaceochromogenes]